MRLNQILTHSELLTEVGDAPYNWKWVGEPPSEYSKSGAAKFTANGSEFVVDLFHSATDDTVHIFWTRDGKFTGSDSVNSQVRVMFTIMDVIKTYIPRIQPRFIQFSADKNNRGTVRDRNRLTSLYTRLINRFADPAGYTASVDDSGADMTNFLLSRNSPNIDS